MVNDAVLQVRIDKETKEQAEVLFEQLGISFAAAVRMFAVKSIQEQRLPFDIGTSYQAPKLVAGGIAHKYADTSKWALEKKGYELYLKEKYDIR